MGGGYMDGGGDSGNVVGNVGFGGPMGSYLERDGRVAHPRSQRSRRASIRAPINPTAAQANITAGGRLSVREQDPGRREVQPLDALVQHRLHVRRGHVVLQLRHVRPKERAGLRELSNAGSPAADLSVRLQSAGRVEGR